MAELACGAADIGLAPSEEAFSRFRTYLDTLMLWRRRFSLTAATTPLAVVREHILDSLQIARFLRPEFQVVDLGSGAGFPGISLAIVCAECSFILVESHRKKANFLREVARAASLANVEVVEQRAEALHTLRLKPSDVVVSRAVWSLSAFLALSEQLLNDRGLAIAMRGSRGLAEAADYHGALVPYEIFRYALSNGRQHALVIYQRP